MDLLTVVLHNLITMALDLIFLHGAFFPRCTARVDKHFADYHSLQFMASGAVELLYDRQAQLLRGRWFWPAYPGPRIRFHAARGCSCWSHRYVAFRGPLVGRWASEGLMLQSPCPPSSGVDWARWFDDLLTQSGRRGRWGTLAAINRLERILIKLAETRATPSKDEPWLGALLQKLDQLQVFEADAFAAEHGMALSTLRRRFRDKTGMALHDYAIQVRIARAQALLSEGDMPIKVVAQRLGYQDVYFFSRQFRQQTGLPPAAFRRTRMGMG